MIYPIDTPFNRCLYANMPLVGAIMAHVSCHRAWSQCDDDRQTVKRHPNVKSKSDITLCEKYFIVKVFYIVLWYHIIIHHAKFRLQDCMYIVLYVSFVKYRHTV